MHRREALTPQTDFNPVSGVGKFSQIVFALVAPGHVVANIVASALAEAGAMQAGVTVSCASASPRGRAESELRAERSEREVLTRCLSARRSRAAAQIES